MSQPYVGVSSDSLNAKTLQALVKHCFSERCWHCLQWPHMIKFQAGQPADFSSTEGQVFDQNRELRWKQSKGTFDVLLLSENSIDDSLQLVEGAVPLDQVLKTINRKWATKPLPAKAYPPTETRFPRELTYPKELDLGQRYFLDANTEIVHFVALRDAKHDQ